MEKNVEYKFEDLLLIRKFYGDVTVEVLIFSLKYMIENKLINKNYIGIISDFREANFLTKQDDLLSLKDLFLKYTETLGHLKFAQIIITPEIAQTMLFESENPDVTTRSFSTIQAAKNWINQ